MVLKDDTDPTLNSNNNSTTPNFNVDFCRFIFGILQMIYHMASHDHM